MVNNELSVFGHFVEFAFKGLSFMTGIAVFKIYYTNEFLQQSSARYMVKSNRTEFAVGQFHNLSLTTI